MIAKTKASSRTPTLPRQDSAPAWTTEERLQRIEVMAKRINEYVKFMCEAGGLKHTSSEATDRAIVAFFDQMVVLESQLGRIHDEFKLE